MQNKLEQDILLKRLSMYKKSNTLSELKHVYRMLIEC